MSVAHLSIRAEQNDRQHVRQKTMRETIWDHLQRHVKEALCGDCGEMKMKECNMVSMVRERRESRK